MATTGKAFEPGHGGRIQESANGDSGRALGKETAATSGQDAPKGFYRRLVAGPRHTRQHGAFSEGLRIRQHQSQRKKEARDIDILFSFRTMLQTASTTPTTATSPSKSPSSPPASPSTSPRSATRPSFKTFFPSAMSSSRTSSTRSLPRTRDSSGTRRQSSSALTTARPLPATLWPTTS